MKKGSLKNTGFTLIEVLIAITVFAIGILAVISMQSTAVNGNAHAQRISEASNFAADQMETLMGLPDTNADLTDVDGNALIAPANIAIDQLCCQDGNDPQGNAVAGCISRADHCKRHGMYDVYWYVVKNAPASHTRIIQVVVTNKLLKAPVKIIVVKAAGI